MAGERSRGRCEHVMASGEQCKLKSLADSAYCQVHEPSRRKEVVKSASMGGKASKKAKERRASTEPADIRAVSLARLVQLRNRYMERDDPEELDAELALTKTIFQVLKVVSHGGDGEPDGEREVLPEGITERIARDLGGGHTADTDAGEVGTG